MNSKKKITLLCIVILIISIFSSCTSSKTSTVSNEKKTKYPEKTISLVSYFPEDIGPGRIYTKVAEVISKKRGWNFKTNKIEHITDILNETWKQPHDGYTVAAHLEGCLVFPALGLAQQTAKDWNYFQISQDIATIVVRADSQYKSIADLVNAAKEKPDTIKVGNVGLGQVYHVKMKIIEKVTGAKFLHPSYTLEEDAIKALMNGEVQAITVGVPSVTSSIAESKLRPLTITDLSSFDFGGIVGKVSSIVDVYPEAKQYLPLDSMLSFAMPADVPKDVVDEFGQAFEEAMNSPEVKDMLSQRNSLKLNQKGKDALDYMLKMEGNYVWIASELGMAKVSPETLGIPKPKWNKN